MVDVRELGDVPQKAQKAQKFFHAEGWSCVAVSKGDLSAVSAISAGQKKFFFSAKSYGGSVMRGDFDSRA